MSPPARPTARLPRAAPLLLALAAAGCAGGPTRPLPGPHALSVNFRVDPTLDRACPFEVVVDETGSRCLEGFLFPSRQKDCLNVGRGDEVTFTARLVGRERPPGQLDFALDFDPFRRGSLPSRDGRLSLRIDPRSPPKTYTFNVFSGDCPVVDPRIVIQP
ncbi:MAG: hypothetical protein IPO09_03305 [Anaeromyxobacter sp.]|nr:hypothetical protein [Anaeromyxobacter sp.]MBL0275612.1 hypothetical protein [Anaeromyxobacter sp.]